MYRLAYREICHRTDEEQGGKKNPYCAEVFHITAMFILI